MWAINYVTCDPGLTLWEPLVWELIIYIHWRLLSDIILRTVPQSFPFVFKEDYGAVQMKIALSHFCSQDGRTLSPVPSVCSSCRLQQESGFMSNVFCRCQLLIFIAAPLAMLLLVGPVLDCWKDILWHTKESAMCSW